jgi:hypothetical protein
VSVSSHGTAPHSPDRSHIYLIDETRSFHKMDLDTQHKNLRETSVRLIRHPPLNRLSRLNRLNRLDRADPRSADSSFGTHDPRACSVIGITSGTAIGRRAWCSTRRSPTARGSWRMDRILVRCTTPRGQRWVLVASPRKCLPVLISQDYIALPIVRGNCTGVTNVTGRNLYST